MKLNCANIWQIVALCSQSFIKDKVIFIHVLLTKFAEHELSVI